ncbi:MAG: hypothetical protein L0H63_09240 [Nitrococcus sp.]|nr:hypothetical protein [Nitrococcus sp.]
MKENLLPSIVRAPWLRVIIVGQRVPAKHGESWEGLSADLIELCPPTVEEWLSFGKLHKSDLTLERVRYVHELAHGKSGLLAQLLGPGT